VLVARTASSFPLRSASVPWRLGAAHSFGVQSATSTSVNAQSLHFARAIEKKLIDLEGAISICAWCKRIHNGGTSWQPLDRYIESHSKTKFTHGLCQDCLRKLDPVNH
jgi:hypothetical protein